MHNWQYKVLRWSLAIILAGTITAGPQARAAVDILSTLKLFGIGYVVDLFSSQFDSFINTITLNKGLGQGEATKVVPIVSAGTGVYVGAAQVTGPASQVARVQAVGQLEGAFFSESLRAKALVPLDSKNPLQGMRRVEQVGISAVIDITIESPDPMPRGTDTPEPNPATTPTLVPMPVPPARIEPTPTVGLMPLPNEGAVLRRYPALAYALFSRNDISMTGSNVNIMGSIRANDDIALKGNHITIMGEVLAGDEVEDHKNNKTKGKNNDVWQQVSPLKTPWFSWSELKSRADNVYAGKVTLRAGHYIQGMTAIDGDLILDGVLQGGGVLIVRGHVTINRGGAGAEQGLLIWSGGDIRMSDSNTSVEALLLSDRSIKVSGSNIRINGGLIGNDVSLSGSNISIVSNTAAARYLPY